MHGRSCSWRWLAMAEALFVLLAAAAWAGAQTTLPASRPASRPAGEAATYLQWVSDLADPKMEGRGAGTKGIELARDYLAEHYRQFMLKPAFGESYTQPFEVRFGARATKHELAGYSPAGRLRFTLRAEKDFTVLGFSASGSFKGDAVFVGYGATVPQHEYDSYGGDEQAAKGKVAICFRYEPMDEKGQSKWGHASTTFGGWSAAAVLDNKARWAAEHGAVALLVVDPPGRKGDALLATEDTSFGQRAKIPVLHVTPAAFERMLGVAGEVGDRMLADLQKKADASPQPVRPLEALVLAGDVKIETVRGDVHNVAAELPGTGELAREVVLVGGHYDHLGYGGRGSLSGGGRIHPGADDNASGTCGVLMLAKWFAERARRLDPADTRPRRTLIFANFAGEEIGLVGSRYMATHLGEMGLKADQIVAMINLDMIGRVRNDHIGIYGVDTAKQWRPMILAAARGSPLKPNLGGGAFGGSDQMSFSAIGVPNLFFNSGGHREYHTPADTADKINSEGAVDALRIAEKILLALWTEKDRPEFDAKAMAAASRRTYRGPVGSAYLGIMPELSGAEGSGCGIAELMPGSPAEAAGLKAGDVIQKLDGKPIADLQALLAALAQCKPDQKVTLTIRRDGKPLDVAVTLGKR